MHTLNRIPCQAHAAYMHCFFLKQFFKLKFNLTWVEDIHTTSSEECYEGGKDGQLDASSGHCSAVTGSDMHIYTHVAGGCWPWFVGCHPTSP